MTYKPPSRWDWLKADVLAVFIKPYRCSHHSHRWGLKCLRYGRYQHMCGVHAWCGDWCPRIEGKAGR